MYNIDKWISCSLLMPDSSLSPNGLTSTSFLTFIGRKLYFSLVFCLFISIQYYESMLHHGWLYNWEDSLRHHNKSKSLANQLTAMFLILRKKSKNLSRRVLWIAKLFNEYLIYTVVSFQFHNFVMVHFSVILGYNFES